MLRLPLYHRKHLLTLYQAPSSDKYLDKYPLIALSRRPSASAHHELPSAAAPQAQRNSRLLVLRHGSTSAPAASTRPLWDLSPRSPDHFQRCCCCCISCCRSSSWPSCSSCLCCGVTQRAAPSRPSCNASPRPGRRLAPRDRASQIVGSPPRPLPPSLAAPNLCVSAVCSLAHLRSKQDLAELFARPELLAALAASTSTAHPSTATSQAPLRSALDENVALASRLNELEARLAHLRSSTQAQLLSAHALERQWRQKQSEMDRALAPFSPSALYQKLGQGVAEQEMVCRALEESFLDGDGGTATEREAAEWVRRYRDAKKVYYSRRERKERWDEGRVGGWR